MLRERTIRNQRDPCGSSCRDCDEHTCACGGTSGPCSGENVPERQEAAQQQQLPEQRNQHQEQGEGEGRGRVCLVENVQEGRPLPTWGLMYFFSQSVDSSLGGLSRSSTVASLDTDSTKSSGGCQRRVPPGRPSAWPGGLPCSTVYPYVSAGSSFPPPLWTSSGMDPKVERSGLQ